MGFISGPRTAAIGRYATILGWLAILALLASLVFRTIATGHGPFANMYEFSMAFAFGILVAYIWFERRYHQRILALVSLPVALVDDALRIDHPGQHRAARPGAPEQPPADRPRRRRDRRLRLVRHRVRRVACCTCVQPATGGRWGLPKPQVLDEIGYRAVVVGFPFLTLTIILGAVWADTAWGSYWSWDPKETASLVTWFIYGAYLHARVMRGWRGKPGRLAARAGLRGHPVHLLREPVLRRAPQLLRPGLTAGPRTKGVTTMSAAEIAVRSPGRAGRSAADDRRSSPSPRS